MGLSTDFSLTSVTTTGLRPAATRPAKPDPTGTCVAPRHRRPRPAEAAGSSTAPDSSSSSSVAVSECMTVRTSSTRPCTGPTFAVTPGPPPAAWASLWARPFTLRRILPQSSRSFVPRIHHGRTCQPVLSQPPTHSPGVVLVRRTEPVVQEPLLGEDRAPENEQHRGREQHDPQK